MQDSRFALGWLILGVLLLLGFHEVALGEAPKALPDNAIIQPGYTVKVYAGPWQNYTKLDTAKPLAAIEAKFSTTPEQFSVQVPEGGFIVLEGLLSLEAADSYWFSPGWQKSSTAVMSVGGNEVYRKLPTDSVGTGGEKLKTPLDAGLHSFRIVHFTPVDRLTCFSSFGRLGEAHVRFATPFTDQVQKELVGALNELTEHVSGKKPLPADRINQLVKVLEKHQYAFGKSESIIRAAIDFVNAHDASNEYLFKTKRHEWNKNDERSGLRWGVFLTMQFLLDHAFTENHLAKYPELLGSLRFATSDYFPGPVTKPADPNAKYSVKIWATFPRTAPQHFWLWHNPARKPTGAYLCPGTIATVTVPQSLVNRGYQIRVGAHANDLIKRPPINRLWRSSLLYPIRNTEVKIASPLGGGIYIEVPAGADQGEAEITFQNIVRSPFYSNTSIRKTSLEEWQTVERKHPAPWADFQSDAFMMQLPRVWVYNLDDPVSLMADWDKAVLAVVKFLGFTLDDVGREAFYIQPDTQLRNSVFSPGHPQVNSGGTTPGEDKFNGNKADDFHLRGPQYAPDWVFHEWGHYVHLASPPGEIESSNNLLHAIALNWGLGVAMDQAFGTSRGSKNPFSTLDNTAILWMTGLNFSDSVMGAGQKSYQLQGHAKFANVARLFGWQTLSDFYRSVNQDRIDFWKSDGQKGENWDKTIEESRFITRMSMTSGVDMRPIFHFWGVAPKHGLLLTRDVSRLEAEAKSVPLPDETPTTAPALDHNDGELMRAHSARKTLAEYKEGLDSAKKEAADFEKLIAVGKVKRSAKIYDELLKFKSLIPPDNAAFRAYALNWYQWKDSKPPTSKVFWTEADHRKQWDAYNKDSAAKIANTIDEILKFYFPDGRPKD